MNELQIFSQSILNRSKENSESFACLYEKHLYGNCFSILRQELDSLIRIFYLLNIDNPSEREHYISLTLNGEKWSRFNERGRRQFVTDREMVEITSGHRLMGWANYVYKFGCGFIHLSQLHNIGLENAFRALNHEDRVAIIRYINQYHDANLTEESSLEDFIPHLPNVMNKVASHVCYYTTDYLMTNSIWARS